MENTKRQTAKDAVVIGLKLLLICAVIAAIVSFVYALTLQKYNDNLAETKNNAISEIFGKEGLKGEKMTDSVSEVFDGNASLGYCVEVTAKGFGGDIGMMVGYRADGSILGVSIINHSETPGLGARIKSETQLTDSFRGKSGELQLADVDAYSGATVSSKAVLAGVNEATKLLEEARAGH